MGVSKSRAGGGGLQQKLSPSTPSRPNPPQVPPQTQLWIWVLLSSPKASAHPGKAGAAGS